MRYIAHVDMDAFFAYVEQLDRPELRGKPVIVGGNPFRGRSVVSSASYEAREYGVHSGMPVRRAYSLCPHAVFVYPRFYRYEQLFWQVAKILLRFSPAVELASIDEAYIDLSGTERLFGNPVETAYQIKLDIRKELGLVASVGIAPNKLLAKIASDSSKPDGFLSIDQKNIREFLDPLPVCVLPGVGKKFTESLACLGIHTIADVLRFSENSLMRIFGKAGSSLYQLALGNDDSPVKTGHMRKGISNERTFDVDISSPTGIRQELLLLCDHLASRMAEEKIVGRTITLKVRYSDFTTITRSHTIPAPTRSHRKIYQSAISLLKNTPKQPVRLLGISVSNISPASEAELDLFEKEAIVDEKLLRAIMEIRSKYGELGIVRAFDVEQIPKGK